MWLGFDGFGLDFWNGFDFGWVPMDVAMVVGWVVAMLVFSGCEISVGLVVAGSVWF